MSLIKKEPTFIRRTIHPFYTLQTDVNKLFNHFLLDSSVDENFRSSWRTEIDLKETAKEFILTADLPGFNKKDISVHIEDNVLVLKGERKFEETRADEKYHYTERSFGSFERHIPLPEKAIDKDKKISAKFENGILTVIVSKKISEQKTSKAVEIE